MNQDEKARIIELREEGLSYTEIAKRMDISKNTIKSFCRRNGITETKKIREIWVFVNFAGSQFLSLLEERKKDSAQIAVETNGGIAIWMR